MTWQPEACILRPQFTQLPNCFLAWMACGLSQHSRWGGPVRGKLDQATLLPKTLQRPISQSRSVKDLKQGHSRFLGPNGLLFILFLSLCSGCLPQGSLMGRHAPAGLAQADLCLERYFRGGHTLACIRCSGVCLMQLQQWDLPWMPYPTLQLPQSPPPKSLCYSCLLCFPPQHEALASSFFMLFTFCLRLHCVSSLTGGADSCFVHGFISYETVFGIRQMLNKFLN